MRSARGRVLACGVAAATVAATGLVFNAPVANAVVAGAGFTTNNPADDPMKDTCLNGPGSLVKPTVNCNSYADKSHVWINGGPTKGQNSLSEGTYFFAVLEPGGQRNSVNDGGVHNLSDADQVGGDGGGTGAPYTERIFTVGSDGKISGHSGGHDTSDAFGGTHGKMIRLAPYDTTSNAGGVYILALCRLDTAVGGVPPVSPSACKYDAFRVRQGDGGDAIPPEFGTIAGSKYYDANFNGVRDAGEEGVPGWQIDYVDGDSGTFVTGANGAFASGPLAEGVYTVTERASSNTAWYQTGNRRSQVQPSKSLLSLENFVYTLDVADNVNITHVNSGNVCKVVSTGGRTIGAWANSLNSSITETDLTRLRALNLVNENGTNFDPTSAGEVKTFLNGSSSVNAKNMAHILSGQLLALDLNVVRGHLDGTDTVLDPQGAAYNTISGIVSAASASIGVTPITTSKNGAAARPAQEALKKYADDLNQNNGLSVVPDSVNKAMTRCGVPTFSQ